MHWKFGHQWIGFKIFFCGNHGTETPNIGVSADVARILFRVNLQLSLIMMHLALMQDGKERKVNGHLRILNWRYLPYIRPM